MPSQIFKTLALALLFSASVSAQSPMVNVQGTHYSIALPDGFYVKDGFPGIKDSINDAFILITEYTESYKIIEKRLTAKKLSDLNVTLKSKESIQWHGKKATLVVAAATAKGVDYCVQMLVAGDGSGSVLASAWSPATNSNLKAAIKVAMLSMKRSELLVSEIKEPYTLSNAEVNFVKTNFPIPTYSDSYDLMEDSPMFMVRETDEFVPEEKQLDYIHEEIGEENDYTTITLVTIDGMSGYEVVAEIGKGEIKQLMYVVVLFHEKGMYTLGGIIKKDLEATKSKFKKMAFSFKRNV